MPILKSYKVFIDGIEKAHYDFGRIGTSPMISWTEIGPSEIISSIVNTKGVELPSTGGIGTTLFYIIGAILIIGAGVLLVTRRRVNSQQ